jgi:hypothetical protein
MSKKCRRCQSAIGRLGYSNKLILSNLLIEPTDSTTATTLSSHVVKTTGTGNSYEGIIPVASLFSSMDFIQPSVTTKKAPPSYTPTRPATSFHQIEREDEQTTT